MPVELRGQSLKIRIKEPDKFTKFRTQDVGKKGRLQRIAAYSKDTGWETQSWRLNLDDYEYSSKAIKEIEKLDVSKSSKKKASKMVRDYFKNKNLNNNDN